MLRDQRRLSTEQRRISTTIGLAAHVRPRNRRKRPANPSFMRRNASTSAWNLNLARRTGSDLRRQLAVSTATLHDNAGAHDCKKLVRKTARSTRCGSSRVAYAPSLLVRRDRHPLLAEEERLPVRLPPEIARQICRCMRCRCAGILGSKSFGEGDLWARSTDRTIASQYHDQARGVFLPLRLSLAGLTVTSWKSVRFARRWIYSRE